MEWSTAGDNLFEFVELVYLDFGKEELKLTMF